MENKISAIIPVYNEDKIIGEALESLKDVVDEIIVIHDGKCDDSTIEIAKKFTKKVFIQPHKGRSAFPVAFGLKKAKYNWILKIDADESLSKDLENNLRSLVKENNIDAFSFIHPLWDGKKAITKKWPRKTSLVRKSTISYLGFPGFDASINTTGKVKKTSYIINKPLKNQDVGWKGFKEKVLKRYAPSQAKYILKEFKEFPTFKYNSKDFPLRLRIRRTFPLITNSLYAVLVFFKQLFYEGAIKEGSKGLNVALKTFIYNNYLGYLIHKEKYKLAR
jgi:glycosyltransferase involved in cell wall biosynthesis